MKQSLLSFFALISLSTMKCDIPCWPCFRC